MDARIEAVPRLLRRTIDIAAAGGGSGDERRQKAVGIAVGRLRRLGGRVGAHAAVRLLEEQAADRGFVIVGVARAQGELQRGRYLV